MSKLTFKEWLFNYFAIDYDTVDVTEQTKQIWRDAYQEYLVLSEREVNHEIQRQSRHIGHDGRT